MLVGVQKPMLGMKLKRAHPLTKGLVGCWLFNEGVGNVAYDSSGYGNHGTLTNMAFPPTTASGWNPGKDGVGLAFDGSSDYVDCGNDASLNLTDAITIEVRAKLAATTFTDGRGRIVFKYESAGSYCLEMLNGGIWRSSSRYTTNGWKTITGGTTLALGIWYQLVFVYSGTEIRLYLNGNSDATPIALIDTLGSNNDKVWIGANGDDTSQLFNGLIDSVKIYNRALSASEIKWSYLEPYAMFERGELLL